MNYSKLPFALVWFRIIVSPIIGFLAFLDFEFKSYCIVFLMIAGLLSDIFDGILARKLKVSNIKFRQLDSKADTLFWFFVFLSALLLQANFFLNNLISISVLLSLYLTAELWSYLKFKKFVAFHTILSKIWALFLTTFFFCLFLQIEVNTIFNTMLFMGILTQVEIIILVIALKEYHVDISGIQQLARLKNGLPPNRNKWFNG